MSAEKVEHINDGDNRRRLVLNGQTLGWITKWHERDAVNDTGVPRFYAKPIGASVAHNCESYSSAVAYIRNYLS